MPLLADVFDTDNLTPHGFCLSWDPGLMGLHIVSDALIGLSYFSIPICLAVFLVRRRDLAFPWIFGLFAVFIVACGTTHLFGIWTLWHPDYLADGAVKAVTAMVSVLTAISLWPLLPRALALPSPAALRLANERLQAEIAERERAEDMLREAQKMEALGKVTGGIAHDFNNLLTAVAANVELLDRRLAEDPALRRYTSRAMDAVGRGGQLTQQLLAFARRQVLKAEPVDVGDLVEGMLDLIRGSVGGHIAVEFRRPERLWRADADPTQLGSALLNLVVNARDAMPNGGRIGIAVENRTIDADDPSNLSADCGEFVALTVEDNGTGMPKSVQAQAFEPFFTTKPVGKGSGLGLSQVYGFVTQLHGHIALNSVEGRGTAVTLFLRRSGEPVAGAMDPALPATEVT